jgi:hypothetical protein
VTDRVIPDDVKLMKGFTIQLVRKRTEMYPMCIFVHVMLALYVSNVVSYFLGMNVAIVPQ